MEPRQGAPARDGRIWNLLAAVEADLSKAWTVPEMAQLANLSVSRLEHIFVAELAVTPTSFLSRARLNEAHRLLYQTDLSVKDVALNVGYRDRSYFNRRFKAQFGCPPGAIRRAVLGSKSRQGEMRCSE
jgi:AraC family transcriptional regulator